MSHRSRSKHGIKKLSGWFKKINGEDLIGNKTHKTSNGVSIYKDDTKLLAAEGSGTICLKLEELKAFNLDLIATNALLRLSICQESIKLYCIYRGRFILLKEQNHLDTMGMDDDLAYLYWVSFEATTRTILLGKHQPSFQNVSFFFTLPPSNKTPEQYWMNKISRYRIDTPAVIYSTRQTVQKAPLCNNSINLLGVKY